MGKTKVLSVRLSLEALQSCFDLCEALDMPTNGGSGAIARTVECLTKDLRNKGTLPTYTHSQLSELVKTFIGSKNPTSMASFEKLSLLDQAVDRRTASGTLTPNIQSPTERAFSNEDFAPAYAPAKELTFEEIQDEANEYKDLIEEQILAQVLKEEEDLLSKILIGG